MRTPLAVPFIALLITAAPAWTQSPCSSFDQGDEGWTLTPGGGIQIWQATGGNPNGHLTMEDSVSGALTAFAPSQFLGNLTAMDGGMLSVDLREIAKSTGTQRPSFGHITIRSSGGTASYDLVSGAPPQTWTTFAVSFDAASWSVTQTTWTQILGGITQISMDVDSYNQFTDKIGFDNFKIARRGSCTVRNGSGVNPLGFACTTPPAIGTNWTSSIPMTAQSLSTYLALATSPALIPFLGGEILIGLSPPPVIQSGQGTHSVPVPNTCALVGVVLTAQGLRVDSINGVPSLVLFNAQDLILGV